MYVSDLCCSNSYVYSFQFVLGLPIRLGLDFLFNHPALAGRFMKTFRVPVYYFVCNMRSSHTQSSLSVPENHRQIGDGCAAGPLQLWMVVALRWRASKGLLHPVPLFSPAQPVMPRFLSLIFSPSCHASSGRCGSSEHQRVQHRHQEVHRL